MALVKVAGYDSKGLPSAFRNPLLFFCRCPLSVEDGAESSVSPLRPNLLVRLPNLVSTMFLPSPDPTSNGALF
jgi:hypothetical protein